MPNCAAGRRVEGRGRRRRGRGTTGGLKGEVDVGAGGSGSSECAYVPVWDLRARRLCGVRATRLWLWLWLWLRRRRRRRGQQRAATRALRRVGGAKERYGQGRAGNEGVQEATDFMALRARRLAT
jgi:hypothetical protein